MIQSGTELKVSDNSGAKVAQCIKVLGGSKRRYSHIGSVIKVSIKDAAPKGRVKKGEVYDALIIRTKKGIKRSDSTLLKFDDNAIILLNTKLEPIGSRIFGPVVRELKNTSFVRILSLALEVI